MGHYNFAEHKTIDICGSSVDPHTHIFQLDNKSGVMVRYACFDTQKGGEEVNILQITDLHLHDINKRDEEEENPAVYGSLQHRMAFRSRSTLPNLKKVLNMVSGYDQVVVTGDTLDYLTWGSLELMEEYLWNRIPGVWITVGGHDLTRVMQSDVPDPTSLESRYQILRKYWRHDMNYCSRVLGGKVMLIQMNNGEGRYFDSQYSCLKQDLDRAGREGLMALLFQHEPICTHNPKEKSLTPLRINDDYGSRNFYEDFMGNDRADETTKKVCRLIRSRADVLKGVFCGHRHCDHYTEIMALQAEDGQLTGKTIPQYVLTGNMYDSGHIMSITVK